MSTVTEMTDEERLEIVRRCTYLMRVHGRQVTSAATDKPEDGLFRYEVEGLVIVTLRQDSTRDYRYFVPDSDKEVVKGSIRLHQGTHLIFSVAHRANVRPSVLKDYMWRRTDLGAKALVVLRNAMVLDDLADL